jgi:hypothetical protein
MKIPAEERRQIENEMLFRRINEKVGADLDALDAMHREDGNLHLVRDADLLLSFRCECSDEHCTDRIPMKLSEYQKIHTERSTFIVRPGHQVDSIEKVLEETDEYTVVKKNHTTPEPDDRLSTASSNSSTRD